jgi:hypothetical protein
MEIVSRKSSRNNSLRTSSLAKELSQQFLAEKICRKNNCESKLLQGFLARNPCRCNEKLQERLTVVFCPLTDLIVLWYGSAVNSRHDFLSFEFFSLMAKWLNISK